MCFFQPNQLEQGLLVILSFLLQNSKIVLLPHRSRDRCGSRSGSRMTFGFYCHWQQNCFLLLLPVAVEQFFGLYCHWQQKGFLVLLPLKSGCRSGSRNGSRISKWLQKKKWQQKSTASISVLAEPSFLIVTNPVETYYPMEMNFLGKNYNSMPK